MSSLDPNFDPTFLSSSSLSLSPSLSPTAPSQDVHSQGEVIACLEKALVRQAEQQDHVRSIKEECQRAILRVAELSSDDFHLDRHLYFSCRDDRERFCQNVRMLYLLLQDFIPKLLMCSYSVASCFHPNVLANSDSYNYKNYVRMKNQLLTLVSSC